jgi:crossover junction endodeoxyribonuclease RusA
VNTLRLTLPYPPSVNRIWRSVTIAGRARVLMSRDGREYRQAAIVALRADLGRFRAFCGPVAVVIRAHPPDARRRDLDNALKAANDALTHAGIWADDSQVADLRIIRMPVCRDQPRLEVEISEAGA